MHQCVSSMLLLQLVKAELLFIYSLVKVVPNLGVRPPPKGTFEGSRDD